MVLELADIIRAKVTMTVKIMVLDKMTTAKTTLNGMVAVVGMAAAAPASARVESLFAWAMAMVVVTDMNRTIPAVTL